MIPLLLLFAQLEGRPLFYWGARPPVILVEDTTKGTTDAQVTEVHAALDRGTLVLRFTFDRPVREATHLPDGRPVSGRLSAILYIDADADRETGLGPAAGTATLGADRRLEIGAVYVGEDEEEKRAADVFVTAKLSLLQRDGRRRTLWRGDHVATSASVSAHGPWVEVRLPPGLVPVEPQARFVLATEERTLEGRLK